MNRVAFVTYNSVGEGLSNGWHEGPEGRQAYVLQNSTGNRWAVEALFSNADDVPDGYSRSQGKYVDHVRNEIDGIWRQLQEALSTLDHIVIYLGSRGSELAIELASSLPTSQVTFVGCKCGLPHKEGLIQQSGLADVGRLLCECGGRRTMRALFECFMTSGQLLPEPALT